MPSNSIFYYVKSGCYFIWKSVRNLPRLLYLIHILLRYDIVGIFEAFPVFSGKTASFRRLRWFARVNVTSASTTSASTTSNGTNFPPATPGQNLVTILKLLGPSYIKLGQVMSTRVDLFGEPVCQELSSLQDELEGFDGHLAIGCLIEAFDKPLDQIFSDFDSKPVSAASVAQVHKALDLDGNKVAVKILRPRIEEQFSRDLYFMSWVAGILNFFQPKMKPEGIIDLYRQQVVFETDLRLEASANAEFSRNFSGSTDLKLPRVDWSRTSKNVLTMEWVEGIPIDDRESLLAQGFDLKQLMFKAAHLFFKSVFEHGYFHGDQHPGNMFVTFDGRIMFVDFGIMGRVSWQHRCFFADLMLCLIKHDFVKLAHIYAEQGFLPNADDIDRFAHALRAVTEPIIDQPLNKVSFAKLLGEILQMGTVFGLEAQPDMFLLQKNMLMAEGISRQLTPDLNIWTLSEPLVQAWISKNRNPLARGMEEMRHFVSLTKRFPDMVDKLEHYLETAPHAGNQRSLRWIVYLVFILAVANYIL